MKIKKGDNIVVITGSDKGKKGKVFKVFPDLNKIVIEGVNVKKRHKRPTKSNEKGQIINISLPLNVSNVMLIDPKTNKPTRLGKKLINGKYVRVSKRSGQEV